MLVHMAICCLFLLALVLQLTCAQYFTTSPSSVLSYVGSSASSAGLFTTIEPTCLVSSAAVWARSAAVEMWAISGGLDQINEEAVVVRSTDGYSTFTSTVPTYTTPNAILRKRRAGGAALLLNGTLYNATNGIAPIVMWGGNTDDNDGDAAIYVTKDDFATIYRPAIQTTYARFAYTTLPFTNYIIQVGGSPNGLLGGNEVWISTDQLGSWGVVNSSIAGPPPPFPPFLSGNLVALYDSVAVPASGATQQYSTVVLHVPAYPASLIYSSTDGAMTWSQLSNAPWNINQETGQRKGMAWAVDASNVIYATGGNTASSHIWASTDKGMSWNIVVQSAGSSTYAASYGSCLGVIYPAGSALPTLVLYSGQIYTSLALTAGSAPYQSPQPGAYAISFPLSATATAPNNAPNPPVYPGTAVPSVYFALSYNQSVLFQLQYGSAYSVCMYGQLSLTAHLVFGDSTPSTVYQIVTGVSGTRVFANQTAVQVSSIFTPAGYVNNASAYNYLYPLSTAKVDAEGITFYFTALQWFSPLIAGNTTAIVDTGDAQTGFLDTSNPDSNSVGSSFQLSTTAFPASTCPTSVLAAPPTLTVSGAPPIVQYMADCSPQVGTVQPGAAVGGQCTQNAFELGIDIVATGVTSPFIVQLVAPNGATALCSSPALNDSNPLNAQLITCFPESDFGKLSQWVAVQVKTLTGNSNAFPGLLFNGSLTAAAGVFPPAIYTVTGSGCTAAPLAAQQVYGVTAISCGVSASLTLTISGDWFTQSSTAYINGVACQSTSYVSSSSVTCSIASSVLSQAAVRSAVYGVQLVSAVGASNTFQGMYLGSAAPPSYYTASTGTDVAYTAAASSGTLSGLFATVEPTCLQDAAAVWAGSSAVEMWAISGGYNEIVEEAVVVRSSTAFSSFTSSVPTYTLANAILRNRRAGGAGLFVNGSAYSSTGRSLLMWGGITDDDVGDAAIYLTQDDFATIGRPRVTSSVPSPCPAVSCTTAPTYARFAYAVLPFTNYMVQVGGGADGIVGTNDVFISTDQLSSWLQLNTSQLPGAPAPFPPLPVGQHGGAVRLRSSAGQWRHAAVLHSRTARTVCRRLHYLEQHDWRHDMDTDGHRSMGGQCRAGRASRHGHGRGRQQCYLHHGRQHCHRRAMAVHEQGSSVEPDPRVGQLVRRVVGLVSGCHVPGRCGRSHVGAVLRSDLLVAGCERCGPVPDAPRFHVCAVLPTDGGEQRSSRQQPSCCSVPGQRYRHVLLPAHVQPVHTVPAAVRHGLLGVHDRHAHYHASLRVRPVHARLSVPGRDGS